MARTPAQLAAALNARRATFKAFLTRRVGNAALAEDLLQDSLIKAMRHAGSVTDAERTTAWFYRVLRHAVIDHYRSAASARRRDDALGTLVASLGEDVVDAPSPWEKQLCGCLKAVANTLQPPQAELIRRVDLEGESVQAVARELGLTANHASVLLHRGRKELRVRLERFCGACAEGACLDCDCATTGKMT